MNIDLKKARKRVGATQRQVAREACLAERQYQDYEYGKKEPGVRTAIRIAEALGVPAPDEFKALFIDKSDRP